MAVTYGFYNSLNKDRVYNAEQMSAIFDGIITDGVFSAIGDGLMPIAGTGMQVIVKTGKCWFNSTWTLNDALLPLDIETADVSLTRIDAIVVEINSAMNTRANSIKIIKGTPSATPAKPTLSNTATLHQYALGYVTVAVGVTSINAGNIEVNVGKTGCPFITSVLQQTSITDLFNQWESEFLTWFNNVQAQLSGDVAVNLQNQIDAIVQNGYGKNGVVSDIIANSDISELYSGLDTLLNTMSNDEEKRFKLSAGSSVFGGGTYEGTLRKHATGWATATLYGYWEKYTLITLTRNGTDNAWYWQSVARKSDVNAVGDIKLTQAKVDEEIWAKCDGRSLNANSSPLKYLNGVIAGAAVEKIVTVEEVFGSQENRIANLIYWYINNKIAYVAMDGTNLKIFFYDTATKTVTSKVIKASETSSSSPGMYAGNAFRANGRIFFSCQLVNFLGVSNYADCLFSSNDDGNTWQYIVTATSNFHEKLVYSAQWCENIQKYIFQLDSDGDDDALISFIGNVDDGTFLAVGGLVNYRIAVFNPISKKYIKFYQVYDSSNSAISRLYWYETTNIDDDGSAPSNPVLINTATGTSTYNGQKISSINYTFDKTNNQLYVIIAIKMTTGRSSYTITKKIINITAKTITTITNANTGIDCFGESAEASAIEIDSENNIYYIYYLNNNTHSQILSIRTNVPSQCFVKPDHYDTYKYLEYIYTDGFMFISSPNAQNNKIIRLPNLDQAQDATYYMKIANEK